MNNQSRNAMRHWADLYRELKERITEPLRHPSFVFYFVAVILVVGGLGVSLSMIKIIGPDPSFMDLVALPRALSSYLLAILASAVTDLILGESSKRSLQMFALFLLVIGVILGLIGLTSFALRWAYGCSLVGVLLAWCLWFVANADNAKLKEREPPPNVATGGDPGAPLPGSLEEEGIRT
jgi:hypothetical protein